MNFLEQKNEQKIIVTKYFSNEDRKITLKKGEVLLGQYARNNRLFYVKVGKICGYLPDKRIYEAVFAAATDSFVGVYSYFSKDHKSYSKLVADEDSIVYYFDEDPFQLPAVEAQALLSFLFNTVVQELRFRQHYAARMAYEREATLHKLIQTEKLATLGQMAAGLAHELNNTIGSFGGNLRQLESDISEYIVRNQSKDIMKFFQKGLEEGQQLSSYEARKVRDDWSAFKLSKISLKKLAKSGITPKEIPEQIKDLSIVASFWNLGFLLHDMKIAADQATHVVNSIRSMGIANQNWSKEVNVNTTLTDALAIVRAITKKINLEVVMDDTLPTIEACSGELVQVWINLIKNAVESLVNDQVESPTIRVISTQSESDIIVSVEDNGVGISEDIIEKIYEPNFTTKVRGLSLGLGLGLTIVKRIVNEHEGSIAVSSRPGKTKFKIVLKKTNV